MANLLTGLFSGASSGSRPGRGSGTPSPREPHSVDGLRKSYESLAQFRTFNLEKNGASEALVEIVREITEALVWGEQHDPSLFDYFCEKSILSEFIGVLGKKRVPRDVNVQILQTLSMLMQNLRRRTSVYYMLSNNRVNNLITTPLDLSDEEVLAYYVTLLKSLAVRLDTETIKFYFLSGLSVGGRGDSASSFPLYTEATKLTNHRDQMVRTTVRAITLQVYRLQSEDPAMHDFLLQHGEESYFEELAKHLKDLWVLLEAAVDKVDQPGVEDMYDMQQDFLSYMADIFDLGITDLNKALAEKLLQVAIFPLLAPLVLQQEVSAVRLRTSLFLLRQVLDNVKSDVLYRPCANYLFEVAEDDGKECGETASDSPKVLLDCLQADDEAVVMLACSVLHAILCPESLQVPPLCIEVATQLRVLQKLTQALCRRTVAAHRSSVQILSHFVLEVFNRTQCADITKVVLQTLKGFEDELADYLLQAVHARTPGEASGTDEVLMELPELCDHCLSAACAPLPSPKVIGICHDLRWLWLKQGGLNDEESAFQERFGKLGTSLHDLVVIRNLLSTLHQQVDENIVEDMPTVHLAGEQAVAEEFSEGNAVEMQNHRKIVCGVSAANGKVTRYFLCTDYWMLLVQPAVNAAGKATVTTRWPLRLIDVSSESEVESARTLHVTLRSLAKFLPQRGTAVATSPRSMTVALNFEDAQHCRAARDHVLRRLQELTHEVREQILNVFLPKHAAENQEMKEEEQAAGRGADVGDQTS